MSSEKLVQKPGETNPVRVPSNSKNVPPKNGAPKSGAPKAVTTPPGLTPPIISAPIKQSKEDVYRDRVLSNLAALEARRESLPLVSLKDDEIEFFRLVEEGDPVKVEKFMTEHKSLNINCINYQGISALHIAIKKENEELVKALLKRPDLELRDAALHAVATGNLEITSIILEAIHSTGFLDEMKGYQESPEYSPDITPLMLAAQCSDYKMVRMLLKRDHTIEKPHMPSCLCQNCKNAMLVAGSSLTRNRLNAYQAISDPTYICQITNDPILYGFLLDKELKKYALMDKEFRTEYGELGQKVRDFTVGLLSQCRNTTEIEMLLKLSWGYKAIHTDVEFPRLQLALDYNQKEFVGHSMVQQVLTYYWLGEYKEWPRLSLFSKICHVFARILFLPFICLSLMFVPHLKALKKCQTPLNRFLLSLASYIIFVIVVFLLNFMDTGRSYRGPPHTGLEAVVVVYVIGYIWTTFKQYWVEGRKRFFNVPWHWYDMFMELTYFVTFIFWIKSYFDAKYDRIHKKRLLERKFWHCFDATLLHEGCFAVASILTFGRLGYFCLQSSRLGPLQVSMGKMAVQIIFFLFFCFLVITSFAMPMSRLYTYYDGMVQTSKDGQTKTQLSSFSTFSNSLWTFFWAMFCMSPVESADVIIENLVKDAKEPKINHHGFTEAVGRTLFATYELLMAIALLNTLIAILSNTFQKVVDNADVEWKFARTKMWVHYFHETTPLPSPFNLLPTPDLFVFCYKYCMAASKKTPGAKAGFSINRCCFIEYEDKPGIDTEEYEALMSSLVQRYFRAKDDIIEEDD